MPTTFKFIVTITDAGSLTITVEPPPSASVAAEEAGDRGNEEQEGARDADQPG